MKPWLKLAIEAGPLVIFFVVNGRGGLPELRNLWHAADARSAAQKRKRGGVIVSGHRARDSP